MDKLDAATIRELLAVCEYIRNDNAYYQAKELVSRLAAQLQSQAAELERLRAAHERCEYMEMFTDMNAGDD
jgi:hypothetical protein